LRTTGVSPQDVTHIGIHERPSYISLDFQLPRETI
jgi:hypothetical protein